VTEPTKTYHQTVHPKNFKTLTEALNSAEQAETGMNFYAGRGELIEAVLYSDLAKELVPCPLPLPIAFSSSGTYAETLRRVLDVADASAVIVAPDYQKLLGDHLKDYNFKFFPKGEDLAYIQFSSGTTSNPKGIAVSHQAVMANIDGMASNALKLESMDRGVSWLPFYHDMGLVGCMLLPIASHVSIDYLPTRDFIRRPALWITLMSRNKATLTYAPTFGYDLAAKRMPKIDDLDLSSWRIAGIGGDMIKPDSIRAFSNAYEQHGFRATNFLPSYGLADLWKKGSPLKPVPTTQIPGILSHAAPSFQTTISKSKLTPEPLQKNVQSVRFS